MENVRWSLKSDNIFREFISKGKGLGAAAVILILGILFIVMGASDKKTDSSQITDDETRLAEMCSSTEGVGDCRVMITYKNDGEEVYAVAVLCDGADNTEVRASVIRLVGSLYGIGSNRISILKLEK